MLHWYFRSQLAKHFATTRLGSVSDPARWDRSVPTILLANHTNWWDGPLALIVARELGLVGHVLMEAANLERYRIFRLAGALPIRRDSPRAALSDLMAVRECLRPATGLWIFPQGARRPQGERPTHFERGPAALALAYGGAIRVCPVALRYIYLSEQLPEAFVWLGPPRMVEPAERGSRLELAAVMEGDLLATIDVLDGLLRTESVGAFRTIVAGRLSINKRIDRFRHAVGLLRGPFEARNG